MWRSAAIDVALSLLESPAAVRFASTSPLPGGVSQLLKVAAGEQGALRTAQATTGRSQVELREAAGFYIEQILFHPQADCYRILGASSRASRSELRQHMALLIKWLHPDGREQRVGRSDLDRGVFIHRVTKAWEQLKTDERRAAYDRSLNERQAEQSPRRGRTSRRSRPPERVAKSKRPRTPGGQKPEPKSQARLIIQRFKRDGLLGRMFSYLWTRR
jgi:hypothetical protein